MKKESRADAFPAQVRRWLGLSKPSTSAHYEFVSGNVPPELLQGWRGNEVASRQRTAFAGVLKDLRRGKPREDFVALAEAIKRTQSDNPLIIEVGCGSGWNSEVLNTMNSGPFQYVGVDYSHAMITLGRRDYPSLRLIESDATALPLRDRVCDILLSGTVLMHLLDYRSAIAESRRVTRRWCIFHTVPILQRRATTVLSKHAYGFPVVEIIFNEGELKQILEQAGLTVRCAFESIAYNLESLLGEPTTTRTYLCEAT